MGDVFNWVRHVMLRLLLRAKSVELSSLVGCVVGLVKATCRVSRLVKRSFPSPEHAKASFLISGGASSHGSSSGMKRAMIVIRIINQSDVDEVSAAVERTREPQVS